MNNQQQEARLALIRHQDGFDRTFPALEVGGILLLSLVLGFLAFVAVPALLRRRRYI